jgi:hypothetical protein
MDLSPVQPRETHTLLDVGLPMWHVEHIHAPGRIVMHLRQQTQRLVVLASQPNVQHRWSGL